MCDNVLLVDDDVEDMTLNLRSLCRCWLNVANNLEAVISFDILRSSKNQKLLENEHDSAIQPMELFGVVGKIRCGAGFKLLLRQKYISKGEYGSFEHGRTRSCLCLSGFLKNVLGTLDRSQYQR